ncbi:DUF3152 domain-containing protein [Amycolatopsis sp. H20-H5]|uniref:DUF3152 domain-containing protein n=1 Tax=Amycolatopsis sp. H20-H5 TaxID=3046309 RepID=UPI002DBC716E|nr:DUF3152 domain-containing protein [Amycolatopsis sp. H20-H5]MEC3979245.1 DUF3152 domain-containing protein [Amycolatopsis sp. H20-H5]
MPRAEDVERDQSEDLRTGQYRPGGRPAPRIREDRYRESGRWSGAQPLKASWKPQVEGGKRPPKRRRLLKTYGWRVYVVPLMVVLTALIVFRTATGPAEPIAAGVENPPAVVVGAPLPSPSAEPGVPENPAKPVDLNIPTAELPAGGEFTAGGAGTYHVMKVPPGFGKRVGTKGTLYTYTIEVENGIDSASYLEDDSFASQVEGILSEPRSWPGTGKVSFQRVDSSQPNPSFRLSLTTPDTAHRPDVCGFSIKYESSCYTRKFDRRVVINLARWIRGALAFGTDIGSYRQYAINHEVGHALGNGHLPCPANGDAAPVMMQQTFGVANDYVAGLNKVDPGNYSAVPADGKVCRYNPWPNPSPG